MSAITISKNVRARIQVSQWARNGDPVSATHQNRIADQVGYLAYVRPKFLFHRGSPLTGATGGANIPDSTSGTRPRWRFAWRSGPYARYVYVQMELAPQNAGAPGDPYGLFECEDGAGTVIGKAEIHWGNSDGSFTDVPANFGGATTLIVDPTNEDNQLVEIEPDTDYWGRFSDVDYGRIVSVAVWEFSLSPDTGNGYPSNTTATGAPVFDADREDPATMARILWKKGGQQLINWSSDTDATAPTLAAAGTAKNIIGGSTSVSASTPGWTLDMQKRTTMSRAALGVPVVMKVTATATAGDSGWVRLLDSSATTVLECACNEAGTKNYAVTGYLPATLAKYDLRFGGNASGSLTPLAVNVYEYDAAGEVIAGVGAVTFGEFVVEAEAESVDPPSITITLVDNSHVDRLYPEASIYPGPSMGAPGETHYTIEVALVGEHNDLVVELRLPIHGVGGNAGVLLPEDPGTLESVETALASANSDWTVTCTEDSTHYVLEFAYASGAPSDTLLEIEIDGAGAFTWALDGSDYTPGYAVVLSGESTEVPSATGESFGVSLGDIIASTAFDPSPVTDGDPVEFEVSFEQVGNGAGTNEMVIQISDAVTCSSPTTVSNPNSWTIGSWSSPGGGVQWECTATRAPTFSGTHTITFETTPSEEGTLAVSIAASNALYTDNGLDAVTVESAITWTIDATSGKPVPANSTEWTDFIAYYALSISVPSNLWLCQEASGNLADSIGSYTLTAQGSPTYNQAVTGWSRLAVRLTEVSSQGFIGGTGTLSPASSVAWMALSIVTTPAGNRPLLTLSNNTAGIRATMSATPRIGFTYDNVATTNGTSNPTGAVRPFLMKHDITNSEGKLYTNQETITPTYQASRVDGSKGLGTPGFTSAPSHTVYLCAWAGGGAESLTSAQVAALYTALGF